MQQSGKPHSLPIEFLITCSRPVSLQTRQPFLSCPQPTAGTRAGYKGSWVISAGTNKERFAWTRRHTSHGSKGWCVGGFIARRRARRAAGGERCGAGRSGGKESGGEAALGGGQALPSSNRPPAALAPPGTAFRNPWWTEAGQQRGGARLPGAAQTEQADGDS